MSGFVARQTSKERIILPIWHRITRDEIMKEAPPLADIVALNSSTQSMEEIVNKVVEKVGGSKSPNATAQMANAEVGPSGPTFGVFYVGRARNRALAVGEEPHSSSLALTYSSTDWLSVTADNEELEYYLDGNRLRVRLDWQDQWQ